MLSLVLLPNPSQPLNAKYIIEIVDKEQSRKKRKLPAGKTPRRCVEHKYLLCFTSFKYSCEERHPRHSNPGKGYIYDQIKRRFLKAPNGCLFFSHYRHPHPWHWHILRHLRHLPPPPTMRRRAAKSLRIASESLPSTYNRTKTNIVCS